jgi:tRNA-Thr(GGU) m(6)t(6)A37 methyltransferase TsaA
MASPDLPVSIIGVVRSSRFEPADTPVQAALNPDERAILELDPAYRDGLLGLDGFDYAWLISWLGQGGEPASPPSLRQVPLLLGRRPQTFGIFATRGPRRVNPIGLSLVRLWEIDDTTIHFSGVDLVDGTPVVDLKPYVTRFDRPPGDVRCGWLVTITMPDGATPAQLRPPDGPPSKR